MGSFIHSTYMGKSVPLHFLILLPVWWLLIVYVVGVYGRAVDPSSVLYHAQRNLTSLKQVLEFSLLQDGIDVCLYVSSAGNCSLPVYQHEHMRTLTLAHSHCTLARSHYTLAHLHTHTAHSHTCTLTQCTFTLSAQDSTRTSLQALQSTVEDFLEPAVSSLLTAASELLAALTELRTTFTQTQEAFSQLVEL